MFPKDSQREGKVNGAVSQGFSTRKKEWKGSQGDVTIQVLQEAVEVLFETLHHKDDLHRNKSQKKSCRNKPKTADNNPGWLRTTSLEVDPAVSRGFSTRKKESKGKPRRTRGHDGSRREEYRQLRADSKNKPSVIRQVPPAAPPDTPQRADVASDGLLIQLNVSIPSGPICSREEHAKTHIRASQLEAWRSAALPAARLIYDDSPSPPINQTVHNIIVPPGIRPIPPAAPPRVVLLRLRQRRRVSSRTKRQSNRIWRRSLDNQIRALSP
uniref:Uncharacterized protein n=1 Tax=Steinernema glaseri TaxID=37863 RepID=A0A1I7Z441_9BILA